MKGSNCSNVPCFSLNLRSSPSITYPFVHPPAPPNSEPAQLWSAPSAAASPHWSAAEGTAATPAPVNSAEPQQQQILIQLYWEQNDDVIICCNLGRLILELSSSGISGEAISGKAKSKPYQLLWSFVPTVLPRPQPTYTDLYKDWLQIRTQKLGNYYPLP